MTRLEAFRSYSTHPFLHKEFKRLKAADVAACEQFISENDHLDVVEFERRASRWFMDVAAKPKHWTVMWGLVIQANTKSFNTKE